jgi:catalase
MAKYTTAELFNKVGEKKNPTFLRFSTVAAK